MQVGRNTSHSGSKVEGIGGVVMKRKETDWAEEIRFNQMRGEINRLEGELASAEKEISSLKEENKELLKENIFLLEKIRNLLKKEIEANEH